MLLMLIASALNFFLDGINNSDILFHTHMRTRVCEMIGWSYWYYKTRCVSKKHEQKVELDESLRCLFVLVGVEVDRVKFRCFLFECTSVC